MTVAAVASLVGGVIIGFAGQRSRMCFVGGIRDWLLVRDTFLLKGLVSFVLVAWVLFPLGGVLGGHAVSGFAGPVTTTVVITVIGGFGVGWFSIVANGCPFRQHVLASQGTGDSMLYLAGFFTGAILFHTVVAPIVGELII